MSDLRVNERADTGADDPPDERADGGRGPEHEPWAYLRAVYALNPGIPHYLDFPGASGA